MSIVGSLVLVRVLTHYLDPTQYGDLALALTLGTLVGQVAFSGSMPGIMRYFAIAAENGGVKEYFSAANKMMSYSALAAVGLSTLLIFSLIFFEKIDIVGLTILAIIFAVLGNFNSNQSMIQNAARQRRVVALHSTLDAWLKVLFATIFLIFFGVTAKVVIAAYILSLSIVLISQSIFIKKLVADFPTTPGATTAWDKEIWQFSQPFILFNAFTWIQSSSDRWALNYFTSTDDVGLYAVLIQLGYTPMMILANLMTALIGPILFQRSGSGLDPKRNTDVHKRAWQIVAVIIAITTLISLFTFFTHNLIFRILTSDQYYSVSYLLPYMILSGGFFSAGQVLSLKLMSDLNTNALIKPKIITSVIGALLSFIGAYFMGVEGVVGAALLFGVLQLVWMAWLTRNPLINHKQRSFQ
jgi:O-antigen/teichoic acid export membrane protein